MFNKYKYANYIVSAISFALELTFLMLALFVDYIYFVPAGVVWALAAAYGGWIQWIGARDHGADGYAITAGYGLQIPFTQYFTIYFTYRFSKDWEAKHKGEK